MKKRILVLMVFSVVFMLSIQYLYAFENKKTHPAITERAATESTLDDYLKTQIGLSDGINSQLYYDFPSEIQDRIMRAQWSPEKTHRPALEWLKVGSAIEDEDGDKYPIRARHHFYDPTRNTGLNNKDDNPNWLGWPNSPFKSFDLTGQSALTWVVDGTASQKPTTNNQAWHNTRTDFYNSLIKPLKSDREKYLAMTFLDLGCVLHLIEDMGVPAHARNDFLFAHYRKRKDHGNPLEKWVERQVDATDNNNIPSNWLTGWTPTPRVFNKVSNYFDTDTRNSNDYLGDGVSPPASWGLAESTNYQFLSWSTIFISDINSLYYFPHPAVNRCDVKDESGRTYLYGYAVDHLARFTMSADFLEHGHLEQAWCTLGEVIYDDYVKMTIPRTIDYATGLANYFFRGRLSVEPNWTDPNIVKLVITNDSNNSGIPQTLKGGTFEIYWDDVNDTRTKIAPASITFTPQWTPASTLPNDGGVTKLNAQFATPAEAVKKYIVVYRGNICENPADLDPNDPNAIAVAIIPCGYEIAAWAIDPVNKGDKYGQVSNVPEGSDFVDVAAGKRHCLAIRSDGSLVGWGYNTHGECNVPAGNDYIAIAAGLYHSIALKSDGSIVVWGWDNLGQTTDKPTGNDFIAIAAGEWHSLALKSDGTIVGWGGYNDYGECDAPAPDPGTVYTAISAGKYHSLALQSNGVVKAWGSNNQGQTRIYDAAVGKVHVAIAACDYYSFLLRDDQMLISWGGGDWISPGIPRYHYRYPDGTDFIAIAAGWDHILSLTSDGEILSWYWPFEDFSFDYFSRTVPEGIVFTDDISAGYDFSLSLKAP